ncbi:MAG: hypothetical protein J1G38_01890 [Clostridiales bacterium]|nr:hypothetical protein [Clostridiales bacterium]
MNNEIVACFPQFANYAYAFKYLFEKGFGVKYLLPPPITKRTMELGSENSPDYVCSPFKYCLGCHIEALELGTNCLAQILGPCRLNYYGELSERILRDMGYEFQYFNMAAINWHSRKSIIENFKIINPDLSIVRLLSALPTSLAIIKMLDKFENYVRHNIGFEAENGEFDRTYKEFLQKLADIESGKQLKALKKEYWQKLNSIKLNKPTKTIKVGMIGDYYTVQEPFANYFMEKELAKYGMEIYRTMTFTNSIIHRRGKESIRIAKKYTKYDIGATSNSTVAEAITFARAGCSGIIQVKSFGCTPETDAMPILQNVSRDLNIPILYFSFDSQTSETGVKTRLEAFYDMVEARSGK